MTISLQDYWAKKNPVRKKEPQYVAFINKNSCTSCNSCASMCPVDCIYEFPDAEPSAAYHVIDTARCIGCQMCFRVPSESTGPWTMEICPWNAIDLIHNPNVKEWDSLWAPYFVGGDQPNFRKLEELGYQIYLNRLIYVKPGSVTETEVAPFTQPIWGYDDGSQFAIIEKQQTLDGVSVFATTAEGFDLVDYLYKSYGHMFLD